MVWTGLEPGQAVPRTHQSHSGLHEGPNKAAGDVVLLKPSSHFISNIIKYTHRKKDEWERKTLGVGRRNLSQNAGSAQTAAGSSCHGASPLCRRTASPPHACQACEKEGGRVSPCTEGKSRVEPHPEQLRFTEGEQAQAGAGLRTSSVRVLPWTSGFAPSE